MKTKMILVLFLVCVSATLASCVSIPYDIPYGVWRNETVGLTLDINPEVHSRGPCSGIYIIDGEENKVEIYFGHNKDFKVESIGEIVVNIIRVGDEEFEDTAKGNFVIYFSGDFKVEGNKLYYTLHKGSQEETGIKDTIVFDLIKEYEKLP